MNNQIIPIIDNDIEKKRLSDIKPPIKTFPEECVPYYGPVNECACCCRKSHIQKNERGG